MMPTPCFPLNSWLACVDHASADVCRAVDAFNFSGSEGNQLRACVAADPTGDPGMTRAKAAWFNNTNSCIWGHWRNFSLSSISSGNMSKSSQRSE